MGAAIRGWAPLSPPGAAEERLGLHGAKPSNPLFGGQLFGGTLAVRCWLSGSRLSGSALRCPLWGCPHVSACKPELAVDPPLSARLNGTGVKCKRGVVWDCRWWLNHGGSWIAGLLDCFPLGAPGACPEGARDHLCPRVVCPFLGVARLRVAPMSGLLCVAFGLGAKQLSAGVGFRGGLFWFRWGLRRRRDGSCFCRASAVPGLPAGGGGVLLFLVAVGVRSRACGLRSGCAALAGVFCAGVWFPGCVFCQLRSGVLLHMASLRDHIYIYINIYIYFFFHLYI